tara:strand:- start:761 stop:940 length:180 start_codon:yes stop_codon:yes gene_type:complete
MASKVYIAAKKEKFVFRSINVLDLIKRNKLEEKREKKNTIIIAAAAISALAVSGLIISL